jgi:DNA-binding MarR family transcriptional regulator
VTDPPITDDDYAELLAFRIELREFLRSSEEAAQDAGLTPAVHQLLLAIRGAEDREPTISSVAAALHVRHHTAVELVQRGEREGLLQRRRDDDDHRQVRLRLTARGRRRLEQLTRTHLPMIRALAERLSGVVEGG